ncbi:TIM44-like domain-containing protein [Moritella sp. 24]|uniref:Tim44 domain-containing protein n=1 Tax=Moritella sp. 24 TaxID=2746230 RepID=UPI001BA49E54|nr:TIM44-like domain-containing protein [Moritella sp. 24]QUM76507.1 TIM44-like domain-containing protein [Moritella sp. 24]
MKNILTVLMMVFAFSLAAPEVHAKKFGGSKSFGKSYKTAPQKQTPAASTPATPAKQGMSKKGMLGGMLGGLLVGGLLASMFGGGAFEGFQFMDMIIMAGVAFLLFRLFKGMMRSKAASQQGQGSPQPASGPAFREEAQQDATFSPASQGGFASTGNDVPFNLPADFDLTNFLTGARSHYKTLQKAWNENDLDTVQDYVSIELYNELRVQRKELEGEQHTEVMFLDAELVRAESTASLSQVSVKFNGRYRDSHEDVEADINEVWHLERDLTQPNAPWLITGIEQ